MAVLEVALEESGYGPVSVLHDVALAVEEGEIVVVLGANGVGKTTLLRTISGVVVQSRGRIVFDGRDVSRMAAHRRARAGIVHVPEGRHVFPRLTVAENLRMGAYAARRSDGAADGYDRVYRLFPFLAKRAGDKASALSGGQQQMLAIARGLMANPRLLMIDEGSLGLSPVLTEQVFDSLVAIREHGTPILMVEQNARAALAVADRAYVIDRGRVTLSGRAAELIDDELMAGVYLGSTIPSPAGRH